MKIVVNYYYTLYYFATFTLIGIVACTNSNSNSHLSKPNHINLIQSVNELDTPKFSNIKDIILYINLERKKLNTEKEKYKADKNAHALSYTIANKELELQDEIAVLTYNFLLMAPKNKENFEGLKYLTTLNRKITATQAFTLLQMYPESIQKSPDGIFLKKKFEERSLKESQKTYHTSILELVLYDTANHATTLANIESEYILLDFWSSWCAPCRIYNKELISKKGKIEQNANIKIVAISLDTDKKKWKKAVIDDNLTVLTVSDFQEFNSPLSKQFQITSIPQNALINKKGDIIARNLWGDSLLHFIKTLH